MKKKSISLNPSLTRGTCKKSNGFTLFELLVSISIIGIMTALAAVAYSGAQKKARDARRVEDIRSIQTAAEQYYSQSLTYSYPLSAGVWVSGTGSTILASFPRDPKTGVIYIYTPVGDTYTVYAALESNIGNAATTACNIGVTAGGYYCAKNQQ